MQKVDFNEVTGDGTPGVMYQGICQDIECFKVSEGTSVTNPFINPFQYVVVRGKQPGWSIYFGPIRESFETDPHLFQKIKSKYAIMEIVDCGSEVLMLYRY